MIKFSLLNFEKEDMSDARRVIREEKKQTPTNAYTLDSPAITTSMTLYTHIINRLANNSNICKTLAAGLVGLIVGLKAELSGFHMIIVLVCVLAISYQDCMYVELKKKLNGLAVDLRNSVLTGDYSNIEPFMIPESKHGFIETINQWKSKSIWIFYLPMILAVFGVWLIGGGYKMFCNWFCNC